MTQPVSDPELAVDRASFPGGPEPLRKGILVSVSRAAHDCSELTATESAGGGLGSATQQFPIHLNAGDHLGKNVVF